MDKKIIMYAVGLVVLFIVILSGLWFAQKQEASQRYVFSELAQCLSENGAVFYGAFWCPACAQQKAPFGSATKKLPYVECSTPDRTGQTAVCEEKGIASYPTWEFADGRRACGIVSAEVLAHLTNCPLPVLAEEQESVQDMYTRLVEDSVRKRFAVEGGGIAEEQEKELQEIRDVISALMLLRHDVSLDDAQDPAPLLSAIYEMAYQCAGDSVTDDTPEETPSPQVDVDAASDETDGA